MKSELFTVFVYEPTGEGSESTLGFDLEINGALAAVLGEKVLAELIKTAAQSILDGYDKAVPNGDPVILN